MNNITIMATILSTLSLGGGIILPASIFFNFMPKAKAQSNSVKLGVLGVFSLLIAATATIWSFNYLTDADMTLVITVTVIVSVVMLVLPMLLSSISRNQQYYEKERC